MLAKQVSRHKEIFCTTDMPLTVVFNKMTELNCPCMPIVESPIHKNIIGTITEHDICLKLINGGLNPQRISAGRVLNGNFTTVNGETDIEECADLIRLTGVERLFVVNEDGAYLGVLIAEDLKFEKPVVPIETVITDLTVTPALPTKIQMAF